MLRRQRGSADPLERRVMGRRWLAVVAAALVSGVYAAQVVVPAAETSPAQRQSPALHRATASEAGPPMCYQEKVVETSPSPAVSVLALQRLVHVPRLARRRH